MHARNIPRSRHGASTVRWAVLTSAMAGLGLAVAAILSQGVGSAFGGAHHQLTRDDLICDNYCGRLSND